MILGFLESVNNYMTDYSKEILAVEKASINQLTEVVRYPSLVKEAIPFQFITNSVTELADVIKCNTDMEDFYTNIYTSPLIGTVPTSIPILDVDEIQDIKPAYLKQFVDKIPNLMNQAINGKLSKGAFLKYTTSEYVCNLRKQVVVTKLPKYVKDSELVNLDNRQVCTVDSNFISCTILPIIRTANVLLKDISKESSLLINTVEECVVDINATITAYNKLRIEKKLTIQTARYVDFVLTSLINVFVSTTKYVIGCFIRKVSSYKYNLQEFARLKETLMRYFPEGESIMDESVLDGVNDFRDEDIVHDLINGNSDFLTSVNERIENYFNDKILNLEFETGEKLYQDNFPYDEKPYHQIFMMFNTIHKGLVILKQELNDPDVPIEEIKEKSGLSMTYTNTFSSVLDQISDVSYYTSYEDAKDTDVYSSILNEMKESAEELIKYGKIAKGIYQEIISIKSSIENNVNNQYENIERNKETIELLKDLNKSYRDFLLLLGRAILNRYENIEVELGVREEKIKVDPVSIDNTDYISVTNECAIELNEISNEYMIESAYQELQRDIYFADMKMKSYFEADQNTNGTQPTVNNGQQSGNTTNNNSSQPTSNTSQQSNQQNNATKVTINDNSAESGGSGNSNGGGGNTVDQGFMQKIIEKIKAFTNTIKDKISKAINTNKANTKWLAANKDALLKRSYVNVSVNILPYQEQSPIQIVDKVIGTVNGLDKKKVIAMDANKIESDIFNSIGLSSVQMDNKDAALGEKLTQCIKIGNQKLQAVTYANSELGQQIPKMIEYCEKYYNGFAKDITAATDKINSTIDQFSKKMQQAGSEQDKSPEGSSLQGNITKISTCMTTLIGSCTNAARDRANDYMTVLNSLVPKNNPADNNQQNDQNNNDQQKQQDEQKQDNSEGA